MQIEHNRNKNTNQEFRGNQLAILQALLRIWTRDDLEKIQQVAKVGLEPRDCRIGSLMRGPLGHPASPGKGTRGVVGGGGREVKVKGKEGYLQHWWKRS